jgi:hypothetical protein
MLDITKLMLRLKENNPKAYEEMVKLPYITREM